MAMQTQEYDEFGRPKTPTTTTTQRPIVAAKSSGTSSNGLGIDPTTQDRSWIVNTKDLHGAYENMYKLQQQQTQQDNAKREALATRNAQEQSALMGYNPQVAARLSDYLMSGAYDTNHQANRDLANKRAELQTQQMGDTLSYLDDSGALAADLYRKMLLGQEITPEMWDSVFDENNNLKLNPAKAGLKEQSDSEIRLINIRNDAIKSIRSNGNLAGFDYADIMSALNYDETEELRHLIDGLVGRDGDIELRVKKAIERSNTPHSSNSSSSSASDITLPTGEEKVSGYIEVDGNTLNDLNSNVSVGSVVVVNGKRAIVTEVKNPAKRSINIFVEYLDGSGKFTAKYGERF